MRILLIDDDDTLTASLSRFLTLSADHEIFTANSGYFGIETAKRVSVDAVITDLDMPNGNGFNVLEYFREHCKHVPVVVLTGNGSPGICEQLLELGANSVFSKSGQTAKDILNKINQLNKEKRSED